MHCQKWGAGWSADGLAALTQCCSAAGEASPRGRAYYADFQLGNQMHEKNKVEVSKVWPPEPTTSRPPEKQIAAVPAGSIFMVVPGLLLGCLMYLLGWIGILVIGKNWLHLLSTMHFGCIGGLAWLLLPSIVPAMVFWYQRRKSAYTAYGVLVGASFAFVLLALYGLEALSYSGWPIP